VITFRGLGSHGRLGNQLSQVTGTLALAWKHEDVAVIDEAWAYRPFFSIPNEHYGTPEGIDAHTLTDIQPTWAAIYMGDYRIIEPYMTTLRNYLQPSQKAKEILETLLNRYQTADRTSVHIRRADYVGNSFYLELGPEYYQPLPDNALIFTEDTDYATATYPGVEVVDPNDDWTDLLLMASCNSHIIANSSYSWWAAALSGNPTISPSQYFSQSSGMPDQSHNLLPNWIAKLPKGEK